MTSADPRARWRKISSCGAWLGKGGGEGRGGRGFGLSVYERGDSRFKGGNQEGILAALGPLEALEALGGLGILEALKGAGMLAGGGGMERGVEGRGGFARGIVGKR